jgi:hypothetical protein
MACYGDSCTSSLLPLAYVIMTIPWYIVPEEGWLLLDGFVTDPTIYLNLLISDHVVWF